MITMVRTVLWFGQMANGMILVAMDILVDLFVKSPLALLSRFERFWTLNKSNLLTASLRRGPKNICLICSYGFVAYFESSIAM